MVHAVGERRPVRARTREDVVRVRHVADAVDHGVLLGQRDLLAHRVANTRLVNCVAVEHAFVHCDHLPPRVIPGAVADPIARVDGAWSLRAQVGVPHGAAPSCRHRHLLAVRVRAGETAVVGTITFADTGDEKAHWLLRTTSATTLSTAAGGPATAASLPATGTALRECNGHRERRQRERRKNVSRLTHRASPSEFA
jgi:hypothetical protein